MSAAEVWCLLAVVAAGACAVLRALAPTGLDSYTARASGALLGAAVACLGAALWVALP